MESIRGKFVTIDGADMGNNSPDAVNYFQSLIRRVMVTNSVPGTVINNEDIHEMAGVKISTQEVI